MYALCVCDMLQKVRAVELGVYFSENCPCISEGPFYGLMVMACLMVPPLHQHHCAHYGWL